MNKLKKLWRFMTTPEMLLYILFGVFTTLINFAVFAGCDYGLHWPWQVSNVCAWILAVIFAFITNKLYVFKSKNLDADVVWREFISFIAARLFSLGVDFLCMWLMITIASWNELLAKIADNVIVIIINYGLSKFIIFNKK